MFLCIENFISIIKWNAIWLSVCANLMHHRPTRARRVVLNNTFVLHLCHATAQISLISLQTSTSCVLNIQKMLRAPISNLNLLADTEVDLSNFFVNYFCSSLKKVLKIDNYFIDFIYWSKISKVFRTKWQTF